MSTPDPVAAPKPPPSKGSGKKWLIGCLVVMVSLVMLGMAVLMLGVYAAKRELDAMTPQQRASYDAARQAELDAFRASEDGPMLAKGAAARARLAAVAQRVEPDAAPTALSCPRDSARANVPVDAEWFRSLAIDVPHEPVGVPWFRHSAFMNLADGALRKRLPLYEAEAWAHTDEELAKAGIVTVIHAVHLREPKLLSGKEFQGGEFDGWLQVMRYPDGDTLCRVPFTARSSDKIGGGLGFGLRVRGISVPVTRAMPKKEPQQQIEADFQERFWAAQEAALGK